MRAMNLTAALMVALVSAAAPAAAQEFKIVVHPANPVAELTTAQVEALFLKHATKFPAGGPAVPVDLGKAHPARAAFSKAVLGRPVAAVENFWQQQIFSGKAVPPTAKSAEDDVLAFVRSNATAIGYVSAAASVDGLKVVAVR